MAESLTLTPSYGNQIWLSRVAKSPYAQKIRSRTFVRVICRFLTAPAQPDAIADLADTAAAAVAHEHVILHPMGVETRRPDHEVGTAGWDVASRRQ